MMSEPKPSKKIDPGVLVGASVAVLTVVGVFTGGLGLFVYEYRQTRWPTTPGRICTSKLERVRTSDASAVGRADSYRPLLEYRNHVSGKEYTGRGRKYTESGTRSWAQKVLAVYPVDKAIQVSYHPDSPARSVLEPGIGVLSVVFLSVGTLL